jgi:farnesyl diphosphate synthase
MSRIEIALQSVLPDVQTEPPRLHDAMRYAVLGAGKRLRPLLCHAAGEVFNAVPAALDMAASALELIHAASLVHDDLPALDNDDLRRGRATVHVQYDEAMAILVGDALFAQAFNVLSQSPGNAHCLSLLVRELAQASGSVGLTGGEMLDLAAVGGNIDAEQMETVHRMKTGSLIKASVRMGVLCAGRCHYPSPALDHYAQAIGLALQIIDDIHDATLDDAALGKTAGKDARDHKPTYVSIHGLETSTNLAVNLIEQAHQALRPLAGNTKPLQGLANMILRHLNCGR